MKWKSHEIRRERKSGVVTIKQAVIRTSSVTIRWERRRKSKIKGRTNGEACTRVRVIQIKNVFSREVTVNVRTVLLLMVEIAKNMKYKRQ